MIALFAGCEAYALTNVAPRVDARAVSPQMKLWGRHSPEFGDNMYGRRAQLSAPTESVAKSDTSDAAVGWYYAGQVVPTGSFHATFGDNSYGRRDQLSAPTESVAKSGTTDAALGWYYAEQNFEKDSYDPMFGDNTYARRASLSGAAAQKLLGPA